MNRKTLLISLFLGLFSLFSLTACNVEEDDFEVTIKMLDKFNQNETTFVQNDEITLLLKIKNTSSEDKELTFSSLKQYDFIMRKKSDSNDGSIVWRWSEKQNFGSINSSYTLKAGQTRTIQYTWDQKLSSGIPLAIDRYNLEVHDIGFETSTNMDFEIN